VVEAVFEFEEKDYVSDCKSYSTFVVSLTSTYNNPIAIGSYQHAGSLLHSDMNVKECDATKAK
jgi:hypothetical protein